MIPSSAANASASSNSVRAWMFICRCSAKIKVQLGDKVIGGETVMASFD